MRIKLNMFFILFLFLSYYVGYIKQSIVIFLCVVLHELGHVWIAKFMKIRIEEVEIFPFGGVARMEALSKYGGITEAVVAIGGPLVSLMLAMLFYFFSLFGDFFQIVMKYNFLLLMFNLIPVLPMDGGRILRNALTHVIGYRHATKIVTNMGKIFAIGLVAYNTFIILNGEKNVSYLITSVFIFIGAEKEMKYCSYYYLLHRNNKKIKDIRKNTIKKRIIKVHEDTYLRFIANNFSPSNLCEIRVIDKKGRAIKVFTETDIMDGIIKFGYDSKITQLIGFLA